MDPLVQGREGDKIRKQNVLLEGQIEEYVFQLLKLVFIQINSLRL